MEERSPEQIHAFDRKRARAFADLERTEGWKYLVELIDKMLEDGGNALMMKLDDGVNAGGRQEYLKGTLYALAYIRGLPSITVASMKSESSEGESDESA